MSIHAHKVPERNDATRATCKYCSKKVNCYGSGTKLYFSTHYGIDIQKNCEGSNQSVSIAY